MFTQYTTLDQGIITLISVYAIHNPEPGECKFSIAMKPRVGNLIEHHYTKLPSFLFGGFYICVDFNLGNNWTKIDCKDTAWNNILRWILVSTKLTDPIHETGFPILVSLRYSVLSLGLWIWNLVSEIQKGNPVNINILIKNLF